MEEGERWAQRGSEAHIYGGERYLISLDISLSLHDVVAQHCHEVLVVLGMGPHHCPGHNRRRRNSKEDVRKQGERK